MGGCAVSHLHLDHDGWIATRDASLTFPSRELLARELESHEERTEAVGYHFPGLRAARVVGGEVVDEVRRTRSGTR
jgi:hypothetical protein